MPDTFGLTHRPVVRRLSATQNDLFRKFDRTAPTTGESSLSSSGTTTPLISRSRQGSIKKVRTKAERNAELELKVVDWIESVLGERPLTSYESFIQDGRVISRVMTSIVFNSVPMEDINADWGASPNIDRVKSLIREIKRYGVIDVFEPEDLLELKNVPKVTKCLAQLSKLAASDKDNLLNLLWDRYIYLIMFANFISSTKILIMEFLSHPKTPLFLEWDSKSFFEMVFGPIEFITYAIKHEM